MHSRPIKKTPPRLSVPQPSEGTKYPQEKERVRLAWIRADEAAREAEIQAEIAAKNANEKREKSDTLKREFERRFLCDPSAERAEGISRRLFPRESVTNKRRTKRAKGGVETKLVGGVEIRVRKG